MNGQLASHRARRQRGLTHHRGHIAIGIIAVLFAA
jgi:hypothetical protein